MMAAGRALDAESIRIVTALDKVMELTLHAAQFETGINRLVRTAVERNFTAVHCRSLFRMNIDDAGRAKSKLSRQGSGDEVHVINQTSIDLLAKTVDSFRDQDIIDSELQVGMFIADMQLTERVL